MCATGALVAVRARVFPEQRILLTNLQTQQDLKCRVVRVDPKRKAAALEFLEPSPTFWRIDFAPRPSANYTHDRFHLLGSFGTVAGRVNLAILQ